MLYRDYDRKSSVEKNSDRESQRALRNMQQAEKSRDRVPMKLSKFFNLPNPSSRTMALGSTQPLTEMSTRNLPKGIGRPARKADNFNAICEPIV
jgi:hypothetical protein